MKRLVCTILLAGIFMFVMVSCSEAEGDVFIATEYASYGLYTETINIILTNNTRYEMIYGQGFSIEKCDGGTEWEEVPLREGYIFQDIAFNLQPNSSSTQEIDLSRLEGHLEPGQYRVVKNIVRTVDTPTQERFLFYAEFHIADEVLY